MDKVQEFERRSFELADLKSALAALSWDQETMMPSRGAEPRARQLSTLAGLYHEKLTDPALLDVTEAVTENGSTSWESRSGSELKREIEKAACVPRSLVEEIARSTSLAYHAWVEARAADDFGAFAPWIEKIFSLKRQEAHCRSAGGDPYETLLDDYEPELAVAELESVLSFVQPRLSALLERIVAAGRPVTDVEGSFEPTAQEAFGREVLTAIGFDWESGRLDRSPHPFCSGFSPSDVRITTRYSETDVTSALFGIIHEGGHALYEQGLPVERFGWPACEAISLGIHESQSRLWENQIGRGRPFWTFWLPRLQEAFPDLADWSLDRFVLAINRVEPSLIRVEADEVTYGLHIVLRFEIERALLAGDLPVEDLPSAWNDRMEAYLGIRPPGDADGVLQDTHWSQGLIGYFPTYLLGNLYAAQLLAAARGELVDLDEATSAGRFRPLREWLRDNVHRAGRTQTASELMESVTGSSLDPSFFLDYLEEKFGALYELD